MNIKSMLYEEIRDEMAHLNKMSVGTEEYKATVDGVSKLVDRAIEMEKIDMEAQERAEEREIENDFKERQLSDERKDRIVRNLTGVVGVILPTLVTIWGTKKSFEFEKTGTITTIIGRGFINKLLPKK